jgi:hypothetical protein
VYVWTFFLIGTIIPSAKLVVKYLYMINSEETKTEGNEKAIDLEWILSYCFFVKEAAI